MTGCILTKAVWRKKTQGYAFALARNEFACHVRRFVAVGPLPEYIGEEEELQHKEYHEELDEDDGPEHLAERHAPETVGIEAEHPVKHIILGHNQRKKKEGVLKIRARCLVDSHSINSISW